MKSLLIILLILTACSKQPETYCFECYTAQMNVTYCGYTLEEMNGTIAWWGDQQGDWKCNIINP